MNWVSIDDAPLGKPKGSERKEKDRNEKSSKRVTDLLQFEVTRELYTIEPGVAAVQPYHD